MTRYDEVRAVLSRPDRFSSSNSVFGGPANEHSEFPSIINLDEPRHGELRSVLARRFGPAALELRWAPGIERRTRALLDASEAGHFDAVADLAMPLATRTVGELLGLPADDLADLKRASDLVVSEMGRPPAEGEEASSHPSDGYERAVHFMSGYFLRAWAVRRHAPGDDLISVLANARVHGRRLRPTEVYAYCILLLISGCETTANLIAQAIWELAVDPKLFASVQARPELARPLIEETLRRESPVQSFYRRVLVDCDLAGTPLRKGDAVLVMFGSANRDEERFSNATALDLQGATTDHLAFGHGIHHCLGAGLARLEARIAIEEIAARFATLRVRDGYEPVRRDTPLMRGLVELPIDYTKRTRLRQS